MSNLIKTEFTYVTTPEGQAIATFSGADGRNNDLIRSVVKQWYGGLENRHVQIVGERVMHAEHGYMLALIKRETMELDFDKDSVKRDCEARGIKGVTL